MPVALIDRTQLLRLGLRSMKALQSVEAMSVLKSVACIYMYGVDYIGTTEVKGNGVLLKYYTKAVE